MKVAAVQLSSFEPNVSKNVERACHLVGRAAQEFGANLVVLPEFFNTIYFPQTPKVAQHWDLAERSDGPSLTRIRATAHDHRTWVVAPIYEESMDGLHFDTAFLINPDGAIAGSYRKTHVPAVDGGYEKLYYTPGSRFPVFEVEGWQVGMLICYDWRFPEAARALAVQGAQVILYPFATPRMTMWAEALATRAWENQVYVAAANRVGTDGTWQFAGLSLIADPFGRVLAAAGEEDEEIICVEIDHSVVHEARLADFNWRDRRPELYAVITRPSEGTMIGVPPNPLGSARHVPVSKDLLEAIGQPPAWSDAVRVGHHVYCTGQVGWDKRNGLMAEGIEAQTRQALLNLREALVGAGSDLSDVVAVRVYLVDRKDHDAYTGVYKEFFGSDPPSRVTVVVKELIDRDCLIDIEAEAIVPNFEAHI